MLQNMREITTRNDSDFRWGNVQTLDGCGRNMSIIAAYNDAWDNSDVDALAEILHDEFVFNPHVGGVTMGKSDALGFAATANTTSEGNRILFENDEVGVSHSVVHFANGSTSEAVLFLISSVVQSPLAFSSLVFVSVLFLV